MAGFASWFGIVALFFSAAVPCYAESISLQSLGVRFGTNDGIDKKTDLRRYEAFGVFSLPWSWQLAAGIDLAAQFTASGGFLDGVGDDGFIATLNPGLCFTDKNRRFSLDFAGGIAVLPDYRLGGEDFGGPLQFTFGGGIGVRLFRNLVLGYRIQHYSDAGLYGSSNRGVDWQLFEIGYSFQ